jgi:hypothetical protein
MCERKATDDGWDSPPVDLDEILGITYAPYGGAKYTIAERRMQGPWHVRFRRWLRGEPQPTSNGRKAY